MKHNKLYLILITLLFILVLATGCSSDQEQQADRTQSVNVSDDTSSSNIHTDGDWDDDDTEEIAPSSDVISKDEARSIVEKHTEELSGNDMTIKLDSDDGVQVYEIDAITSTHKYEFELEASSGDLLSYSKEVIHADAQTDNSASVISQNKVRSIVEQHTSDLKDQDLTIGQDTDDGLKVYEVEGRTSSHKYEFEIDAYSGEILSYEEERIR